MIRSSLASKITLVIVMVSIIGFGASTIWTIHHESVLAIDESKAAARRLAAALVASIETAMLQERPDVTRTLIQELKGRSGVEGLTVMARAPGAAEVGPSFHRALATLETQESLEVRDGAGSAPATSRRGRQPPDATRSVSWARPSTR